jgi:hypothetical protein
MNLNFLRHSSRRVTMRTRQLGLPHLYLMCFRKVTHEKDV